MRRSLLLLTLLVPLSACAPAVTTLVSPPTFRVVEAETSLLRIEPAGVGSGAALVHLELEAHNPNPFAIQLAGLDGDLFLAGQRAAGSSFREGVALPANGRSRLGLDVEVPVQGAQQLLTQFARLVAGEAVAYRMDATVSVDVLGALQRFPSLTVAQGELRLPGGLQPPTVRLDTANSSIRLSVLSVQVDVGLIVDNPLPIGYFVRAPEVSLRLDGNHVGRASLPRTPVAASSISGTVLRFELGLADVGAAMMTRLQGGAGGMRIGLGGDLAVEIPGVVSLSRSLGGVGGMLP
jgi:LEA14-like dessication related protein